MTDMLEFNLATIAGLPVSQEAKDALRAAMTTRGPRQGFLLSKAPRSNTLAYAAWQAAQLVCNPYKVSIFGMLLLSEGQRKVREEITAALDAAPKK